ncbi:uncharacterized protein LOC129749497 [Uranotaenia lowii]|uniref:uncharacterized protein LOC129749497 n=1 Tax=Uranotaenia lowii TaxID=190385 RepID=UPI002478D1EF|nr:uncharacterized protein LOC129749497 [Uranotaenia lowii]
MGQKECCCSSKNGPTENQTFKRQLVRASPFSHRQARSRLSFTFTKMAIRRISFSVVRLSMSLILLMALAVVTKSDFSDLQRFGWFERQHPVVQEFGTYNASDRICYRKKIPNGSYSPQVVYYRNIENTPINYVKLETLETKNWSGFAADLAQGSIGMNYIGIEVRATNSWGPFLVDVYMDVMCANSVPKKKIFGSSSLWDTYWATKARRTETN